jgi:general stress protein 26
MEVYMSEPGLKRVHPYADRPQMPVGYGLKPLSEGRMIPWEDVIQSLTASHNYWVVTASSRGVPHAAPVWGIWQDGAFYFGSDPASRKGRNIAANPQVILHLESGDEVVIVEGTARLSQITELPEDLVERYLEKYGIDPSGSPTYRLDPSKVLAWSESDFPESATRWNPGIP